MLQCGALESANKRHHSRLFDHLGWGHKQRRRTDSTSRLAQAIAGCPVAALTR
jgi:hypothetical protein